MLRAYAVPFITNVRFILGSRADTQLNCPESVILVEFSRSSIGLMCVELQSCGRFFLREVQKDSTDAPSLLDRLDLELLDGIPVDRKKTHGSFARNSEPDLTFTQERVSEELEIVLG